ncbi:MAG: sigma 54-interacting transcriptional regulator [Myxococcaceae bacterium]
MALTEPISPQSTLIRLDQKTGTLRARQYEVTVVNGPDAGKSVPIKGTLMIGSHPEAGLPLGDPTVSRYHLELHARGDGVRVRDLESTNGSFISGARVTEIIVEEEATVTVGKTSVRISISEQDLGRPKTERSSFGRVVGHSEAMHHLFGVLERVAPSDSTVVLLGETGTGKELIAEAVHQNSRRKDKRLVVVDCGAVAPTLIESELFGHIKGSFTGAVSDRYGAFLEADGGTIFLDEIGELPLELQPKLLRVLEGGMVKRVGEDKPRRVNVRVIAATHRDLEAEVEAGRFRRDLYFRLAVVLVRVPPLRERLVDLPMLARHFVKLMGREEFELSPSLLQRLGDYNWPGNVRELRNVIERALAGAEMDPLPFETGSRVPTATNPSGVRASPDGLNDLPFKEAKERLVDSFTKEYLVALLAKCGGNISEVARTAGIARNYVHRLVTKYGLKATD